MKKLTRTEMKAYYSNGKLAWFDWGWEEQNIIRYWYREARTYKLGGQIAYLVVDGKKYDVIAHH